MGSLLRIKMRSESDLYRFIYYRNRVFLDIRNGVIIEYSNEVFIDNQNEVIMEI